MTGLAAWEAQLASMPTASQFQLLLGGAAAVQALGDKASPEAATQACGRKHEDLLQKYGGLASVPADQVTTLMIRNLPRRYTEEALLHELETFIGPGSFNFLYLPWDSRRSSNVGYAFVNLVDAATARSLTDKLDGKPWRLVQTPKEIKIMPAHVQGIALNLVHYMGSRVVEDGNAHAPMVIHNGKRISFSEAVAMYCPPEMLQKHCKEDADGPKTGLHSHLSSVTRDADGPKPGLHSHLSSVTRVPTTGSDGDPIARDLNLCDQISWQAFDSLQSDRERSLGDILSTSPCASQEGQRTGAAAAVWQSDVTGQSERLQVLTSPSYRTAWKKVNRQLQHLFVVYEIAQG